MPKQLTLRIKRHFFLDILRGTKKSEYRDVLPTNVTRYVYFECEGRNYERQSEVPDNDSPIIVHPIAYDTLLLINGHTADAPRLVIEVKSADFYIRADVDGNDLTYEYEGQEYVSCYVEYHLGRIVSTDHLTPEMAEALASNFVS